MADSDKASWATFLYELRGKVWQLFATETPFLAELLMLHPLLEGGELLLEALVEEARELLAEVVGEGVNLRILRLTLLRLSRRCLQLLVEVGESVLRLLPLLLRWPLPGWWF